MDKIAYPFASTLQNGSDYMTFHLSRNRYIYCHYEVNNENPNALMREYFILSQV